MALPTYDELTGQSESPSYEDLVNPPKPKASVPTYDELVGHQQQENRHETLARDPNFDPALHFAEDPSNDRMAEAIAVAKRRAAQPTDYLKSALDFAKGAGAAVATAPYHFVKGVLNAEMNVGTEISPFASEAEQERARRENAAAIQLGAYQGSQLPGKLLHKIFGKSDRNLTDKEWEEKIRHEAAQHLVENEIRGGNLVEGGAVNEAIGFGRAERKLQNPEELAQQGEPIRPENVADASVLADPTTYLIPGAAELLHPAISRFVTAPALKAAGKTIETVGKGADAILRHKYGTLGTIAYAFAGHNPLSIVAGVSADLAAHNLAPKLGTMLTEAGAEAGGAAPPLGQSLARKAFKTGAQGAVTGGVLGVPFAAAADTPEEAGAAIGGGIGMGGVLGAVGGAKASRQIETAAKFDQMQREGAQINYGLGFDDISNQWKATLPIGAQQVVDAYRARFNGMHDANGMPIQIYVAGGADYARALQENGGGNATDTRGFISTDGTKIFVNADIAKTTGRTAETLGHEAGGHLTEFLAEIAQAHDIATLQEHLRGALYEDGRPNPIFRGFIDRYRDALQRGGATPAQILQLESADPRYYEKEYLAEHARRILSGENIANFNLPKTLKERLTQGASQWLQSQGITSKQGGKIGFDGREIKQITTQLRDILYKQGAESEALRTARAKGEAPQTVAHRISQLEHQTATPPTATSTVEQVNAYRAAQRELAALREAIGQQSQPQPATATAQATQQTGNETQNVRQTVLAALKSPMLRHIPASEHESRVDAAIQAATAAGIPVTPEEILTHATTTRFSEKAQPVEIQTPTGRTFRDSSGKDRIVTGQTNKPTEVGDIIVTRAGEIRRVAQILEDGALNVTFPGTTDTSSTYPVKPGDYKILAHEEAAAPESATKNTIRENANGTFDVIGPNGEVVSGGLATRSAAEQSIRMQGRRIPMPPNPTGVPDILDHIAEMGGIDTTSAEGKDDLSYLQLHKRGFGALLKGTRTADQIASQLHDEHGIGDGYTASLWPLIDDAINARKSLNEQIKADEKAQKQAEKSQPKEPEPSESSTPPPSEQVPIVATETSETPPSTSDTPEPAQISEADVTEIAAQAEAAVKAARSEKKSASTLPKAVSDAQIDAVAEAHAQTVPLNYEGVRLRQDATSKQTISGKFNPSRPFDAFLLKMADLSEKAKGILLDLQNRIGQTVTVNYGHAPQTEAKVINESRKRAQKEHSAEARAAGEAPTQAEDKNFIPLEVRFNKGKENPSITILGASPEKLLNNFNLISREMERLQEPVPYRAITEQGGIDPAFVMDMKHLAENHDNGFTFDGRRIQGFPDTPIPKPKEGFKPHVIPKERFEFLNMVLGDESAKVNKRKTPESQLKQSLAVANNIAMSAQGEVNALREGINIANPDLKDADGNPITWSKQNIENPLSEALRVDLINEIKPEVSNEDASIRKHGYSGDIGRFFSEGSPSRTFSAAGFLPDEPAPKTTQERARERMASRLARTGEDMPEINRNKTFYLDRNGKFHETDIDGHVDWAINTFPELKKYEGKEWGDVADDVYGWMMDHGFIRVVAEIGKRGENKGVLWHEGNDLPMTAAQKRAIKDTAIHNQLEATGDSNARFLPDTPEPVKAITDKLGLKYDGIFGGILHQFTTTKDIGNLPPNATFTVRELTPEAIEKKIAAKQAAAEKLRDQGGRFLPDEESEPFFSALTKTIQSIPQETMTVGQALANIRKGAKQDEIKMSGIETDPMSPLAGKKPGEKVSKSELQSYAIDRQARLQDVVLGEMEKPEVKYDPDLEMWRLWINKEWSGGFDSKQKAEEFVSEGLHEYGVRGVTHFSQYQLPGADEGSYREMFVTWPDNASGFKYVTDDSSKGMGKTTVFSPDGLNMGTWATRQSAIASQRRQKGNWEDGHGQYSDIANPIVRIRRNIRADADGKKTYFIEEIQGPSKENQEKMPPELRKRIYEIGMKRALRDAVDEGADSLSWTTGEQQSERYDLSKQIAKVEATKTMQGKYAVTATAPDGRQVMDDVFDAEKLPDVVGKDLAQKIVDQAKDAPTEGRRHSVTFSGLDLKQGGEGLKRLYDQSLPRIANELAKKFGVKVGTSEIKTEGVSGDDPNETPIDEDGMVSRPIHSLPIPDALRSQQRQGNALFLPDDPEQKPPRGVQTSVKQNAAPDAEIYHAPGKTIDVSEDTAQLPEGAKLIQEGGLWIAKDKDGKILGASGSRDGTIQQASGNAIQLENGTVTTKPTIHFLPAHHGTPHEVDSFKLEKVGTGEGAQVYGWGLYFAENPKVAEAYRDALAKVEFDTENEDARNAWHWAKNTTREDAIEGLEMWLADPPRSSSQKQIEENQRALDYIKAGNPIPNAKRTANAYTVDLDVKPDELLDWDKPLNDQSPKVKKALKDIFVKYGGSPENDTSWQLHSEANGETAYAAIATMTGTRLGSEDTLEKTASRELFKAGIPGIRYLDQGSRVVFDQWQRKKQIFPREGPSKPLTYNYVVFDENRIKITHKNGQPVTIEQAAAGEAPESKADRTKRLARERQESRK